MFKSFVASWAKIVYIFFESWGIYYNEKKLGTKTTGKE